MKTSSPDGNRSPSERPQKDGIDPSREIHSPEQWQREIVASRLAEFDAEGKPGLTTEEFWRRVDDLRKT